MTSTNITIPFKERLLDQLNTNINTELDLIAELNKMPKSDYRDSLLAAAEHDLLDNRELLQKLSK